MEKKKNILFTTDFSPSSANALQYTLLMADQMNATVKVFHVVFPEGEALDYAVLVSIATQKQLETDKKILKKFVEKAKEKVKPLCKSPIKVNTEIHIGVPSKEVLEHCQNYEVDLIVVGRLDRDDQLEKIFGNVATDIVSSAITPVLIIPFETMFNGIDSAIYASDLLDSDPFEIWKAIELLKPFEPEFSCIHFSEAKENFRENEEKLKQMNAFFEKQNLQNSINFYQLPGDDLAKSLNEMAADQQADMIVMYQNKKTFLDKILYTSSSRNMIFKSNYPLLIMK